MDFRFYFSLFFRRLHWFMLFLIVGSAIGLTLAKVLPPVYVAQARLLVESEQIPGDLAASTVRTGATEQLQIIQQRILTRDTLVDMANRLDVYGVHDGRARPRIDTDSLVQDMRSRIGMVTQGGGSSATLVSVSFEAPKAQMAATVTNELVTLILREDVGMRTRVARGTLQFFEQDVERLDKELSKLGAAILAFKEENQKALPDSLDFRRNQQAGNQERLVQIERQIAAYQDRRTRMERLFEAFTASGQDLPGPAPTKEAQQLQGLEDELATQLTILSANNPKIKLLEARINGLRARVAVQKEEQAKQAAALSGGDNPLTEYELQIAELDGELEFLEEQKAQVLEKLDDLEASIEATPSNAITLNTLERDYANTRSLYDSAVAKKAQAETGDIIEALRQGQRISIVEQAVVPSEPEKPNRVLIAAAGVGGGMMLGFGMVFLLELLNKGIRRPADLTAALGITPFATLPYYRTRAEQLRRRAIIFGVLGFLLIGIPIALWSVDTYYIQLDDLMDRVGSRLGIAQMARATVTDLV